MPLGGMSIPMTPALASIAATRPRGYFFSLSIGPMMPPIAERVAAALPEMAAKIEQAMMPTTAKPPLMRPTRRLAAVMI